MASSRLSGAGRPRATLAFALLGPALAALAACDGGGGDEFAPAPEARSCSARGCASGVRVEVPGVSLRELGPLPLAFRVCLDARCTDLALRGDHRSPSCEVDGAQPEGQITHCYARSPGPLAFEITRFDGRADEGPRPVVALSARDARGALLFHDAARVSLEPVYANGPACGATCARGAVTFRPELRAHRGPGPAD
ncbi:MAG TPA: hypothetical protein VFS43_26540 [Polyangiaceae bacterium]|nr:hypothetical protein [Polyangiaceae bacterium]